MWSRHHKTICGERLTISLLDDFLHLELGFPPIIQLPTADCGVSAMMTRHHCVVGSTSLCCWLRPRRDSTAPRMMTTTRTWEHVVYRSRLRLFTSNTACGALLGPQPVVVVDAPTRIVVRSSSCCWAGVCTTTRVRIDRRPASVSSSSSSYGPRSTTCTGVPHAG